MKKTLLTIFSMASLATIAQTADFDNLTLSPETYYSGSDLAGEFTSGGVVFKNEYDTQYSYWSGAFAYSNSTDVTTADYTNGYSAYLSNPSSTGNVYAAFYYSWNGATIDFGSEVNPTSVKLTNTTYAALSMRDGDSFGKQFGSINNAQGQPDGTNGEDYFLVKIIGLDSDSLSVDTVIFYLADYRFSNNSQDYIVSDWTNVDLTSLAGSRYFAFEFESSDNGQFGINTPTYFAMDDLMYNSLLGISELTENLSVYPNPANDLLNIQSAAGTLSITDATGKIVLQSETTGFISIPVQQLSAGSYIVELQTKKGTGRQHLIKR